MAESSASSTDMMRQAQGAWWDRAGVFLSSVCMVHCMLTPILMLAMPMGLGLVSHDRFHAWVFWPIFAVAMAAFIRGYLSSRKLLVLILGTAGVGLLALARPIGTWLGAESLEHGVTFLGSSLLIVAHLKNLRAVNHYNHHVKPSNASGEGPTPNSCSACDHG